MLTRSIIVAAAVAAGVTITVRLKPITVRLKPITVRLKPDPTLIPAVAFDVAGAAAQPRVLRWAGDTEGGAPFVEADPSRPDRLVGFDVEIAALLASAVGRTPELVNIRFESIGQSVARGDADIGMSGIEDTPARRATRRARAAGGRPRHAGECGDDVDVGGGQAGSSRPRGRSGSASVRCCGSCARRRRSASRWPR